MHTDAKLIATTEQSILLPTCPRLLMVYNSGATVHTYIVALSVELECGVYDEARVEQLSRQWPPGRVPAEEIACWTMVSKGLAPPLCIEWRHPVCASSRLAQATMATDRLWHQYAIRMHGPRIRQRCAAVIPSFVGG